MALKKFLAMFQVYSRNLFSVSSQISEGDLLSELLVLIHGKFAHHL